jgi:hypothetical protein
MKRSVKILLGIIILFIVIQFIPRDHNKSTQVQVNDITTVYRVPDNVQAIFKNSCYDCHSNNTDYPLYARIQPIRFMMDGHVKQGKEELNFNEFGTYSKRKQSHKLRAIANSMTEGTMPLSSYLFIHHKAGLTPTEKTVIIDWVKKADTSD